MKKKILITSFLLIISSISFSQTVFSTAQTLQKGAFSVGLNPVYATVGNGDFALFFHGGMGTGNNSDIGLKLGFGWSDTYVGLDYEKMLFANSNVFLSGSLGAHYWRDFGIDANIIFSFKVSNVFLTTGLDMNMNFVSINNNGEDELDVQFPFFLPLAVEFYLKKHISLIFEANIKLTDEAFTTIGGGINIYF